MEAQCERYPNLVQEVASLLAGAGVTQEGYDLVVYGLIYHDNNATIIPTLGYEDLPITWLVLLKENDLIDAYNRKILADLETDVKEALRDVKPDMDSGIYVENVHRMSAKEWLDAHSEHPLVGSISRTELLERRSADYDYAKKHDHIPAGMGFGSFVMDHMKYVFAGTVADDDYILPKDRNI